MIGGEIVIKSFIAEQKWRRQTDLMFPLEPGVKQISFFTAVMLISKAQIVTDPFMISSGFQTGIIQGPILGIVLMLFTQLTMFIFSRCWAYARAYSYTEVWSITFGPMLSWIPAVFQILLYLAYTFTQSWEAHAYPQLFLPVLWPDCPEILLNQWFLVWFASILVVLPCSMTRRFTQLWPIAYLSFFCLIVAVVCLLLHFVRRVSSYGFDPEGEMVLFNGDIWKLLECAQNYNVAFFLHPFLSLVLKDMEVPSTSRCMRAAWVSNTLCYLINSLGGGIGYLMFAAEVPFDENIFNFLPLENPEILLGNIASYFIAVFSTAYYSIYIARIFCTLVLGGDTRNRVSLLAATLLPVTADVFSTFAGDTFIDMMFLFSNVSAVFLAFVIPPVLYLVQFRFIYKAMAVVAICSFLIGVAFGAVMLFESIQAFVAPEESEE
jgi:hypothetical protein